MSNRVVLIAAVPKGFPSSRNVEKEKRMQLPAASLVQPTPAMCAYDTLTMVWAAIDRVLLCLIALYLWLQYRKASRCRVMGEGKAQLPAASLGPTASSHARLRCAIRLRYAIRLRWYGRYLGHLTTPPLNH